MSKVDKAFETKLNIYLSSILNEKLRIHSISETRRGRGRPDILIYAGGIKIVVEGSYSKSDAEKDIAKKIEEGFADIGIALYYKQKISDKVEADVKKKLEQSKFDVKIFKVGDISHTLLYYTTGKKFESISVNDWFEVNIVELASVIDTAYDNLTKDAETEASIQKIHFLSNDFVEQIQSMDKNRKIAEKLYNLYYRLYGLHIGNYLEISEIIYAQCFLTLLLSITFYQSIQPKLGIQSISELTSKLGKREGLRSAFESILDVDYRSIFQVALRVIDLLPDNSYEEVIDIAKKLSSDQNLLRRDFSGRLYHRVVGDWSIKKGFATYFTTIPASYLLSYLSTFSKSRSIKSPEKIKVCDFTCGSGTLLTASYCALEDLYKLKNFDRGKIDLDWFHETVLEDNIWGFDALRYALQIASLNLVFQNPSVPLKIMNFHSTPLGINDEGEVELGSLRHLKTGTIRDFFNVSDISKRVSVVDSEDKDENIPLFDLIVMNPPFTRATGRGGRQGGGLFGFIVDDSAREKTLRAYDQLRRTIAESLLKIGEGHLSYFKGGTFTSIGAAGEALLFIYLAFQYVNDEGKISFVLPRSLLSGASWFLIRSLLVEKFHVEYVLVSYDKDHGYNFSESTNLSEVLIIAKRTKSDVNQKTSFVMILTKPESSFQAIALAKSVSKSFMKEFSFHESGNARASQYSISRKELVHYLDNWGRFVSFPNVKLLRFIENLNNGTLFGKHIPIEKLGRISELGIDRHQFKDAFTVVSQNSPGCYPIVYGGGEIMRISIMNSCNSFALPVNENADNMFGQKASYLLVPERWRLNTAHVIALLFPSKTLSNMFYAVRLNSESKQKYKALCAWLNSTFALLMVLANREETEGAWISLKLSHWRLQNVLDIDKIDNDTVRNLSKILDKYGDKNFCKNS